MGNACTGNPSRVKRNVTVPSKIIKVRDGYGSDKENNNISSISANTTAVTSKTDNPSISHNKGNNNNAENSPEVINQDLTKAHLSNNILTDQELMRFGIGQYYLEKQIALILNSFGKNKKKKVKQLELKWDRFFQYSQADQNSNNVNIQLSFDNHVKDLNLKNTKDFKRISAQFIPSIYRWSIWKSYIQVEKYYIQGLYESLKGQSSKWEGDIQKDVHRTFPHELYFSKEKSDGIGQEHLFNVLKAVSLYLPNIGYAQSMNFIVAFMLMVNGGRELDAFWAFITLARSPNFLSIGLFEKDFPLLHFYTFIFYEILQAENPALYKHIKNQQIPDLLWLFKWFLTLFIYSLPPQTVLRIWDYIMINGSLSMIKISLGIIKYLEKDIMNVDAYGLDELFKSIKDDINQKKVQSSDGIQEDSDNNSKANSTTKNFDIEKILALSNKVKLKENKVRSYVVQYHTKTGKILPEVYKHAFSDLNQFSKDPTEFTIFQEKMTAYITK